MAPSIALKLLTIILAATLLGGCATPERPRIFWPLPPEQPRLEWIGVYASQDDLPKSTMQQRLQEIVGSTAEFKFVSPMGIVSDGQGKVFVSDFFLGNVVLFDFNANTAGFHTRQSIFKRPAGLALDAQGNLYVADAAAGKVVVLSPQGEMLFSFGTPELLPRPVYLALNERLDRIYVSDGKAHRIAVFDLQGKHLFHFGQMGRGDGDFFSPQGMAVDHADRLFVADLLNARVQVFDADGKFLYKFGQRGDQVFHFEGPKDLAFDVDGNLHIVDARKALLLTYSPEGVLLLATGSTRGASAIDLGQPASIHVDATGRIHIADSGFRRFSVWQYLTPDYLQRHPVSKEQEAHLERLGKGAPGK